MTRDEFKRICEEYEGAFGVNRFGREVFADTHRITKYYDNGKVSESKNVRCEVTLDLVGDKLGAEEKTCAIHGGRYGFTANEDNLRKLLDEYEFKRKAASQISLFDLGENL